MNRIEYLLRKYEKPTAGERVTPEYRRRIRRAQRIKNRHLLLDEMVNTVDWDVLPYEKKRVHHLINHFTDFNLFNRRLSNEKIILCFILMLKVVRDPDTDIEAVCEKHDLSPRAFSLVITRLCYELLKKQPGFPAEQ